jgi:hypothetical protein
MTHAARAAAATSVDLATVFKARCWARAGLFAEGEMDLHDAVDKLQADAVRDGLVAALGQDRVQWMMADVFGAVRTKLTAWDYGEATEVIEAEADEQPAPRSETPRVAPSTIDALRYLIRQDDPQRLRAWLKRFTTAERIVLRGHVVSR